MFLFFFLIMSGPPCCKPYGSLFPNTRPFRPNGLFFRVGADGRADWSEVCFLCDGHAVFDVIEQGKLGEEALGQVLGAAAAMGEPRAFVAAKANEVLDL